MVEVKMEKSLGLNQALQRFSGMENQFVMCLHSPVSFM